MHKIHSHSHLIMDPESAYYGDFGGGFAPSEVIIISRFRIHDQVAVAVDFMQNIRTFGPKFLYLTKIEVLVPHHALYLKFGSSYFWLRFFELIQITDCNHYA